MWQQQRKWPQEGEALGILPTLYQVSSSEEGHPFPHIRMVEVAASGLSLCEFLTYQEQHRHITEINFLLWPAIQDGCICLSWKT